MSRFDLSEPHRIKLTGKEVYLMYHDDGQIDVDNTKHGSAAALAFIVKFS